MVVWIGFFLNIILLSSPRFGSLPPLTTSSSSFLVNCILQFTFHYTYYYEIYSKQYTLFLKGIITKKRLQLRNFDLKNNNCLSCKVTSTNVSRLRNRRIQIKRDALHCIATRCGSCVVARHNDQSTAPIAFIVSLPAPARTDIHVAWGTRTPMLIIESKWQFVLDNYPNDYCAFH